MGFFKSIFKAVENVVSGAVDVASDVVGGAVDIVKDVGRDVDDFVNDAIPGGWGTVAAVTAVAVGAPPGTFSGGAGAGAGAGAGTAAGLGAADAVTAAEWFGGAGAATSPGAIFGGAAAPSAGLLGGAAELASVGETMAPIPGPENVFEYGYVDPGRITPAPANIIPGYATPENVFEYGYQDPGRITPAPADIITPPKISIGEALRGASLARQLLTPQQPQTPNLLGQAAQSTNQMQGAVDYSSLLGLLSQQAGGTGLLGTRFQPQPINLVSLLG
jgi:hypothetical protein